MLTVRFNTPVIGGFDHGDVVEFEGEDDALALLWAWHEAGFLEVIP